MNQNEMNQQDQQDDETIEVTITFTVSKHATLSVHQDQQTGDPSEEVGSIAEALHESLCIAIHEAVETDRFNIVWLHDNVISIDFDE